MIKFGDVRKILDHYTSYCKECECKDCNEEEIDDGIYSYNSCSPDCSTFYARKIKEEILSLLDKEKIETDASNSIPCKLYFKGICKVLPIDAKDGDCWIMQEEHLKNGCGWRTDNTFYWYDDKWNYLPNPPENCKIRYV